MHQAQPDTSDFHTLRHARDLWQRGQTATAIAAFEHALREQPTNVRALIEAARAIGTTNRIDDAAHLLERARSLAAGDPNASLQIARALKLIYRPTHAIDVLEPIARLPQGQPPPPTILAAMAELAVLLEQVNRAHDALRLAEQVDDATAGTPEVRVLRARLLRRLKHPDQARALLSQLIERPDLAPATRAETLELLAQLADAAGDTAAAASSIATAKRIVHDQLGGAGRQRAAERINAAFAAIYERLDRATLDRWRAEQPSDVDPKRRLGAPAFLVGFPRSGTTLLEQMLDAHPRLIASPERVVFTRQILSGLVHAGGRGLTLDGLDAVPLAAIGRLRDEYADSLEQIAGEPFAGRVHLDKNPNHTSNLAPILRLFPSARLIVALRDPRDVVVSCCLRLFGLTEFSAALATWESTCRMYAFEMGIWLRVRALLDDRTGAGDGPRWVEIRYEDLVEDPKTQAARALETLGLDWDDAVTGYLDRTQHKIVNSPSHADVREPIHRAAIGRWRRYEPQLRPHMSILQPFIDRFGYAD